MPGSIGMREWRRGFYCGICPGCGMGIDMPSLKLYFLLRLCFVPAAFLKPLAGTRVVGLARSGAKNHDGCNQLVDTAAVLCEWGWWDMNYSEIKYFDIANGEGVRTSLFVSGCRHGCPGCFNPEQWDFTAGKPFSPDVQNEILESLAPEYVDGLSLLGGEPMEPENQRALVDFVERVRETYPGKTIWCYTGDLLEDLRNPESPRHTEVTDRLLAAIDVLVDGPFVQAHHDITLRFRGSSNQRIIDLPATLAQGKIVPWRDDPQFVSHSMVVNSFD